MSAAFTQIASFNKPTSLTKFTLFRKPTIFYTLAISTHQPFVNISSHLTRPNLFRKPATFYKLSTVTFQPDFNRPALYAGSCIFGTISKRCSHPVPVQYYKEKNVEDTIKRGKRLSMFPNLAVSSHQLLFNATTKPPYSKKHCSLSNLSHLLNVYRLVPY